MSNQEYNVVITITNEKGEVIEKKCSLPVRSRAWFLLRQDDINAVLVTMLTQLKSSTSNPGWMG